MAKDPIQYRCPEQDEEAVAAHNRLPEKERQQLQKDESRRQRPLTIKDGIQLWIDGKGLCYICNEGIHTMDDLEFDHYMPKALGGPDGIENRRLSHTWCNASKGKTHPDEFFEELRYKRINAALWGYDPIKGEILYPEPV